MNSWKRLVHGLTLILPVALAALPLVQCTRPAPSQEPVIGLPNPASVYCQEQGGKSEIRTDAAGNQYGVCIFADGSECDEWAFFRGECAPGGTATPVAQPSPVAEATPVAEVTQPAPPTSTPTPVPPTDTPTTEPTAPPVDTPTTPPTVMPTDTPVPEPTATPDTPPTAMPEQVIAGQTSITIQGYLEADEHRAFTLSGKEEQLLMVDVSSPDGTVFLDILGADDGEPLLALESQATTWTGTLAVTQQYIIKAVATGQASNYTLRVIMPQRITLVQGMAEATIQGRVQANDVVDHVLYAQEGRTLSVRISSPNDNVLLTLYGLDDGQALAKAASGDSAWEGELVATQDYTIRVVAGTEASDYTLSILMP